MNLKRVDQIFSKMYRGDALIQQQYKCHYCFEPLNHKTVTADHVVPRRGGGISKKDNIKASCKMCNVTKGCMDYKEFMKIISNDKKIPRIMPLVKVWFARKINMRLLKFEKKFNRLIGKTETWRG